MFDHLDTSSQKKFKKGILEAWSDIFRALRKTNDEISSTQLWNDLQELKGKFYSDTISLDQWIDAINRMLQTSQTIPDSIKKYLMMFVSIIDNPAYIKYIASTQQNMTGAAAAATTAAAAAASLSQSPASLFQSGYQSLPPDSAFKSSLLEQVSHHDAAHASLDRSSAVIVLMRFAAPENYNGFFIDLNEDITKHIKIEDLDAIKDIRVKLSTIEEHINRLLAEKIDTIITKSLANNNPRIQIILKSGTHYTTIDIDTTLQSCLVMDAAQDFRRHRLFNLVKYSQYIKPGKLIDVTSSGFTFNNTTINGGALQKSDHGCSVFSLHHSFALAQLRDIHVDLLKQCKVGSDTGVSTVDWIQLPPSIVYLAQSTTFLDYYKHKNPSAIPQIDALTDSNKKCFGYNQALRIFQQRMEEITTKNSDEEIQRVLGAELAQPRASR